MIIGFGTYESAKHPRVGILLDGLRSSGYDVIELNHPLGFSTAQRVQMLAQPWRLPQLAGRLLLCWLTLIADAVRIKARRTPVDAVVVGYLGHFDVMLARVLFPRAQIILDHLIFAADTARDRGAQGAKVRLLQLLDALALKSSNLHVVDTEEHRAMLPEPDSGVVVPVGARSEWFDAGAARPPETEGPLRVIFFGLFTPLQGTEVIAKAMTIVDKSNVAIALTMVGRGQDYDATREILRENNAVHWIDWVEPHELPALVARHDVCLGIFGAGPKALRVVPNKVYEGVAAGCRVITSDTAPQRRVKNPLMTLVPPADPDALAQALIAAATNREPLTPAERVDGAKDFSAVVVTQPLIDRLRARGGR